MPFPLFSITGTPQGSGFFVPLPFCQRLAFFVPERANRRGAKSLGDWDMNLLLEVSEEYMIGREEASRIIQSLWPTVLASPNAR